MMFYLGLYFNYENISYWWCGFIGSHLTDFLVSKKHQVLVLDNLSHGRLSNIATKSQNINLKIDIRSPRLSTVFAPSVQKKFSLGGAN